MDLGGLNLNHLAALDALLVERNVRRAAERMGVTQSAMSHTLRALRESFDDPLLVRVGNEMVLTPLSEGIQSELRSGLARLESVVRGRAGFDPTIIDDEFTLATFDGNAPAVIGPLHRRLRAEAPRARLHVTGVDPATIHEDLRTGKTDVALLGPMPGLSGLESEYLASTAVDFVVIVRRGHPRVKKRLTLDAYCDIPHATVSLGGSQSSSHIDDVLAKMGRRRKLEVRVAYVSALGEVLENSDCLALVPRPAATQFFCKRWDLKYVEAPLDLPAIGFALYWHPRFSADASHRFFRGIVRGVCVGLSKD